MTGYGEKENPMRVPRMTTLRAVAIIGLLTATYTISAHAAEIQPIRWVIAEGEEVDKAQATQVYDAACAWIEDNLNTSRAPVQPKLVIHIGEACPGDAFADACFSPVTAELYLRRWEESSVSAVANATIIAGVLQLMDRDQMRRSVATSMHGEPTFVAENRSASTNVAQ